MGVTLHGVALAPRNNRLDAQIPRCTRASEPVFTMCWQGRKYSANINAAGRWLQTAAYGSISNTGRFSGKFQHVIMHSDGGGFLCKLVHDRVKR